MEINLHLEMYYNLIYYSLSIDQVRYTPASRHDAQLKMDRL